jgi:aspartate-semialdehyde dehydrogenase
MLILKKKYLLATTRITIMKLRLKVGIVGATGAVGQTAIDILENDFSAFEVEELMLFASRSSAGKRVVFRCGGNQHNLKVEETKIESLLKCDVVFFATDSFVSLEFIPQLAKAGVLCVDKSSAYREDPKVPLVVPEVNEKELAKEGFLDFPVVANPNCCATPLAVALAPLHKAFEIQRVIVSTYQSVSGSGKPGLDVLREESKDFFDLQDLNPLPSQVYPKAIAFNVFPFVSQILENGDTEEESKLIFEVKKILNLWNLPISATSVRVPTFVGHAESVTVELKSEQFNVAGARKLFESSPGVCFVDEWETPASEEAQLPMKFPTPRDVQGLDPVFVGRVRSSGAFEKGLSFWLCADNLRKGAALNGIQIVNSFCALGLMAKLRQKRSA